MFVRNVEIELMRWFSDRYRKPLVLRGARQVGKTTIVNRFAQNFDNFLVVNLEKKASKELFESSDDVKQLLPMLFFHCNVTKKEGKTLLFIDEIQNSPHTVALLRYFYEEVPEIYVIAAGSLLETMLDKHFSLPVGRVEYLALHPCNFIEFLQATGESRFVESILNGTLPTAFHEELSALFKTFSLIGGMPEVVARYAENRDIVSLQRTYNQLINAYKNDMEKYAESKSQAEILRYILDYGWIFAGETITLGNFGGSPYRARETGEAFRTLQKAMLLEMVFPLTSTKMPAVASLRRQPKLFWLDLGLINHAAKIKKEYLNTDLMDTWRGKAAEQVAYQELTALSFDVGEKQNFWERAASGSRAETDFVYLFDGEIFPIEVKSGHNAHLKSLHQFLDEASVDVGIRLWTGKFSIDEVKTISGKRIKLINLPLYMITALPKILEKEI